MAAIEKQLDYFEPIRISFATIHPHTDNVYEVAIDSYTTVSTAQVRELCDVLAELGDNIAIIYNLDGDHEFSVGAQQLIGSLPNVAYRVILATRPAHKVSIMEAQINSPFDWQPHVFHNRTQALDWLSSVMH